MKSRVILIFSLILLLLASCVSALEVELISPIGTQTLGNPIDFICNINTQDKIYSVILYTNTSDNWGVTKENNYSPDGKQGPSTETFKVPDVQSGTYIWNCLATMVNGDTKFATENAVIKFLSQVNTYPTFSNSTSLDRTFEKNVVQVDVYNLDALFYDKETDLNLSFDVLKVEGADIGIVIEDNKVDLYPHPDFVGTNKIKFTACDPQGKCKDSCDITLTITQTSSTPSTPECTSDSDCDSGYICEDENCVEETTTCTEEWDCDSWSDCEDGYETRDCTDDNDCGTTEDKPSETKSCSTISSSNNEFTIEITKAIPSYNNIKIKLGEKQEFKITTNEDGDTAWYVDNIRKQTGSEIFTYKPTSTEVGSHIIKVIINSKSNENDKDTKTWDIKVITEQPKNLCGNNKIDTNETCLNCPEDVTCQKGEYCNEGICKTKSLSSITGFATKTKNFVVQKWYYPTLIFSIIILLIIILKITKLHKKPKKDEYLAEFSEKKTFIQRLRKKLRGWDRKRLLKKQNKETLLRVKTEKEDNIRITAPGIESIIAFVNQKLSEGSPKRQIKKALKRKGWSRKQIRQALKKTKNDSRKPT